MREVGEIKDLNRDAINVLSINGDIDTRVKIKFQQIFNKLHTAIKEEIKKQNGTIVINTITKKVSFEGVSNDLKRRCELAIGL